jgi:hypothetical protein
VEDGMSNGYYVQWGTWDAEHRALKERVQAIETATKSRRDRAWAIGLMVAGGIVAPILVTAILVFLHLSA